MAVPLFQIQHLVKLHNITLFSSNYALYADMSARIMSILEEFAPSLEQYSIDEAFLDLTGVCNADPIEYGHRIKKAVVRATGIPVCVGMGPTKTLTKLANFAAKKWKHTGGVLDLSDIVRREKLMKIVPVKEVWGIGSKTAEKLNKFGIETVWDLAAQPSKKIQSQFNKVVARTVLELNGTSCLELSDITPDKQQIVVSRSFGRRVTEYNDLSSALSEFCCRAGEKLRRQKSVASSITIFIRTSPFNQQEKEYQRSASMKLDVATQDTRSIISTANRLLKEIFKEGYGYQKCGVQLSNIKPETSPGQLELFDFMDNDLPTENRELMKVLDQINRKFPKAISVAATGLGGPGMETWKPTSDNQSQRYTTDWDELVVVKC